MRGRRPNPVEQKVREGNKSRKRLPEPMLVAGRPDMAEMVEPPAHLDEDGQHFWRTTVMRLVEVGLIDRIDGPMLELAAVQYARARQAGRLIAENGFDRGLARTERDATLAMLRIGEQFAMTAAARTRLGAQELHRRTLAAEMEDALGSVELVEVDD